MDAVFLMLEALAAVLVLLWVASRQGEGGLLGWKSSTAPKPRPGSRPGSLKP